MKYFKIIIVVLLAAILHQIVSSYDNATMHPSMNESAYGAFIESIKNDHEFENYSFSNSQKIPGIAVVNYKPLTNLVYRQVRIPEGEKSYNIKQWIMFHTR